MAGLTLFDKMRMAIGDIALHVYMWSRRFTKERCYKIIASDNTEIRISAAFARVEELERMFVDLRERFSWIPVGAKLPKDGEKVYAITRNKDIDRFVYSRILEPYFSRTHTHWKPCSTMIIDEMIKTECQSPQRS